MRRGVAVLAVAAFVLGLASGARGFTQNPATVFVNELHYDNTGADTGEAIEVAAPAGTDLTGWSLVLYNGSTPSAAVVYATLPLTGTVPDLQGGFGVVTVAAPGLQNGPNDAIALVDAGGNVVQFLGYEGPATAASGVAAGLQSTDIGVSQNGTEPVGSSLQLQGSGSAYQDFTWVATPGSNTFGAVNGGQTFTTGDAAPAVASVVPASGATGVDPDADITVTFTEAVDAAPGAFSLECATSGNVALTVAGGPTSFTLDPQVTLAAGELCTVRVAAALVTDQDVVDPPDAMASDFASTFTTLSAPTITPISAIQGAGSTVTGSGPFTVEAVVVGSFQAQGSGQLRGFFLQEEDADADADPATSEGIFVFCSACPVAVAVGDLVRVTGGATDFFGMSQLTATTAESTTVVSSSNTLPTPAAITLPVPGVPNGDLPVARAAINAYFERFEGMLVTFPATLAVSEYFELARYGQVQLAAGGRPRQFTDLALPSAAGFVDHQIDVARRTILLDDDNNVQNDAITGTDTPYYHPLPGLSSVNFFRGGDTIAGLTGVLHWSFAGQTGTDAWRIRPVPAAFAYAFTGANPRPPAPAVPGRLRVAAYNVLNYFLTIDTTASSTTGDCGAAQTADCRGADSAAELAAQREKLTQALLGLDADVLGLVELENTPGVDPAAAIAADLDAAGPDAWARIDTGVIGTDAIRVGLVYRPAAVTPVGPHAILDSSVDPGFDSSRSRPALAQTFRENATGALLTVVVNHLKSKSDSGLGGSSGICTVSGPASDPDCDQGDGQGFWNATRTSAAQALARWLATDPTGAGDADVMILGDLNAYRNEDPVRSLEAAGYVDLIDTVSGPSAYSFLFSGQLGYLDHALASPSLAPQVAGVEEWHLNADEIPLFDYNDAIRDTGEASFERESTATSLDAGPFRTSDHDPVLVGLDPTPLYRARQVDRRVWMERNIAEAGLGDFDGEPVDGWALVGRTNGASDNGELRGLFVDAAGTPFAVIFNRSNNKKNRCILVTPRTLEPVKKGQTRILRTVADPYVDERYGCSAP
jgi:hypothetical protein